MVIAIFYYRSTTKSYSFIQETLQQSLIHMARWFVNEILKTSFPQNLGLNTFDSLPAFPSHTEITKSANTHPMNRINHIYSFYLLQFHKFLHSRKLVSFLSNGLLVPRKKTKFPNIIICWTFSYNCSHLGSMGHLKYIFNIGRSKIHSMQVNM